MNANKHEFGKESHNQKPFLTTEATEEHEGKTKKFFAGKQRLVIRKLGGKSRATLLDIRSAERSPNARHCNYR
jgi:hypothetical protein